MSCTQARVSTMYIINFTVVVTVATMHACAVNCHDEEELNRINFQWLKMHTLAMGEGQFEGKLSRLGGKLPPVLSPVLPLPP